MRLVKQPRKFFIHFRLQILTCEQALQAGTQNSDRTFQLMGSVSRISGRSFQFFARGSERSLGLFALRAVLFRVDRQLLDWSCKTHRNEMARDKPAEQKKNACAADPPAQPSQLRDPIGQRENADLVSRRKNRSRIEFLVKKQMRRGIDADGEVALPALIARDRTHDLTRDLVLRGFRH